MWTDPVCPWTWIAAEWLAEAAALTNLEVEWRLVSLALIDARTGAGRIPSHRASLAMENVIMAARLEYGPAVASPLYRAMGRRIHGDRRDPVQEAQAIIVESLDEVGLGLDPLAMASEPGTGAALMAEHDAAVAASGPEAVGSPLLGVDGVVFFGPVLAHQPHDQAAADLLTSLITISRTPGFSELKRSRPHGPRIEGRVPRRTDLQTLY
jgi:hypothetical protein